MLRYLTDAHCHIHDDRAAMESLVHAWRSSNGPTEDQQQQQGPAVRAGKFCLMGVQPSASLGSQEKKQSASNGGNHNLLLPTHQDASLPSSPSSSSLPYEQTNIHGDWETVAKLATLSPDRVVPCFGIHPWFTHKYYFDGPGAAASAVIAQDAAAGTADAGNEGSESATVVADQFENLSLIRGPGVRGEMALKTAKALQQQMMMNQSSPSSSPAPPLSPSPSSSSSPSPSPLQSSLTDPHAHYANVLTIPQSAPEDYLKTLAPKLPTPRPFGPALQELWQRLKAHPTALVGEIGLDRTARVPDPDPVSGIAGGAEGSTNNNNNYSVKTTVAMTSIEHQLRMVQEQLRMAAALDRAVSFHCVQAYGHWLDFLLRESKKQAASDQQQQPMSKRMTAKLRRQIQEAEWERHVASTLSDSSDEEDEDEREGYEEMDKIKKKKESPAASPSADQQPATSGPAAVPPPPSPPKTLPPRLCMHSYGGSVDMIQAFVKLSPRPQMYFSFSMAINGRLNANKFRALVQAVPDDRLLIESDYHTPDAYVDASLVEMVQRVAGIKGWTVEETVERTARNWHVFVYGTLPA
ncbi:hypothetical protein BGZ73_006678 [Actinomortierella ambigua]|nr:hypothetical protein BGZ73_006678 [Actinomortierella ambigua]